jgi:hypothetical protein
MALESADRISGCKRSLTLLLFLLLLLLVVLKLYP